MFETRPGIYSEFIDSIPLTVEDKHTLKTKRGFTDETIDDLKFRSVGQKARESIEGLLSKYGRSEMITCGLWDASTNEAGWQWVNREKCSIIMPYLESDRSTAFIKSHKVGFIKGAQPAPYCPFIYQKKNPQIVLCESEFKAAAMHQMGYRAQGLGGVSTFGGEYISKLVNTLKDCQRIIILFDTEIQNDPKLNSYKPDFRRRYAQNIWSYILAKRIQANLWTDDYQPHILIATLPFEWTIDGKADIDSCLAAGRNRLDFDMVLSDSVSAEVYKKEMRVDPLHRPWVARQLDKANKNTTVKVYNNCYFVHSPVKRRMGKDTIMEDFYKEVSNFHIRVRSIIHRRDDVEREVQIYSKYGDVSPPFSVTAADMSSFKDFKKRCLGRGDFLWKGDEKDFMAIVEDMFIENDFLPIVELELVGRDEPNSQWVFQNMVLKDDKTILRPDPNSGAAWDNECGWRVTPFSEDPLPTLVEEGPDAMSVLRQFEAAWGRTGVLAFLYTAASLFSNAIFEHYKAFPFAWICGEKESGKSTLSDSMMAMLGFDANHSAMNIAGTTSVAMARKMAFYSSLPVRFDEYRSGEKKIDEKSSLLRSLYNRQGESKGIRAAYGVREVKIKGALIMIGEEMPEDPALKSRIISMYLKNESKSKESYNATRWLVENAKSLSAVTFRMVSDYKENVKKILMATEQAREFLAKKKERGSFRAQMHYGTMMGIVHVLFPNIDTPETKSELKRIIDMVSEAYIDTCTEGTADSLVNRWFQDLVAAASLKEPVKDYAFVQGEHLFMYLPGIYGLWSRYRSMRGGTKSLGSERTITDYITAKNYCDGMARATVPAFGKRIGCVKLRRGHEEFPDVLKDLIEVMKNDRYNVDDPDRYIEDD